jgi:rare lipoprotein A
MNNKRFFFRVKVWLAAELLMLLLLACPKAWAVDARSEVATVSVEPAFTMGETLAYEGARDSAATAGVSAFLTSPRLNPLELVQDKVKNVLSSALDSVQSNSLVEAGMASWYGSAFQGRRTASGERFDMNQLTAAHKTLPLGTVVQVRNPLNGKTVDVTINDRGPFIKGRIIDLSYRAALALGIVQTGKQPVEVHRR